MQQRVLTRTGAGLLVALMGLCGASPAVAAVPGDARVNAISTSATKISKNSPMASYWMPDAFLKWSPQTDKDLAFNKSTVPLAQRIVPSKLIPTNSTQNKRTKIVALSVMNPHTSGNPSRRLDSFGNYPFDYWQYVDTLVYWAGSASEGLIVPPSADVIDEAHLNGVPVLGSIFLPPEVYGGKVEWVRAMLRKDADGSYRFAKQMVEVAKDYGFDGWFINQETDGLNADEAAQMKSMIQQARSLDPQLQVMWYDSMTKDGSISYQNQLDDENATFISPDAKGPAANSMFLNFGWGQSELKGSASYAKAHQLNPYDLYAGIDVQQYDVATRADWSALESGPRSTHTSIGLYQPNSTYNNATSFEDYQGKEAAMWVNRQADPRQTGPVQSDSWTGLSHFAIEKSAVRGDNFYTDFSLGNGRAYFKNGQKISDRPWSDRSVAHILPTYRWVIDNAGNSKLTAAIDYSKAYNAGDSIKFTGDLDAAGSSTITLFESNVNLTRQSTFSVAMRSDKPLNVAAVLTFADGKVVTLPGDGQAGPEWGTINFNPRPYKGKFIRKIGLKFSSPQTAKNTTINLGELAIFNKPHTWDVGARTAKVDDQAFEEGGSVGGFRLSWQASNRKNIRAFEVYEVKPDGSRAFLGSTNITHFFVNSLQRGKKVTTSTFEIVPVSRAGKDGQAAKVSIDWPKLELQPAFVAQRTVVAPGARVHFLNRSNPAATGFKWIFSGADRILSSEQDPTVTYVKEGTYSVSLLITDGNHHYDTVTAKNLITVSKAAAAGLVDYALGKPVRVDSFTNSSEDGSHAVDGQSNTKWCANSADKHWLIVDLGKPAKISEVRMRHAQAGGESADWNTADYTISVSNDQKSWTSVAKVTGNTAAQTDDAFRQVTARYVKLAVDRPTQGSDSAVRLYGFEVLGLKQQ